MKTLIALLLLVGATGLSAQTKRIAHRSHSGADNTMTLICQDNFGLGPMPHDPRLFEPDSLQMIDSAQSASGTAPSVPSVTPVPPAPPKLPARPLPPSTPEVGPDSTRKPASPSGTDSDTVPAPANISGENNGKPARRVENVSAASENRENREEKGRLLWLALALGVPAAGVVLYGIRRS